MIVRPRRLDAQVVGYRLAQVMTGLGLAMVVPAVVAVALREWNAATAFVLAGSLTVAVARVTAARLFTRARLGWAQGIVTAALAWLTGSLVAALPLYLGGNVGSYGDAAFEAMSGLTTTGLTLVQDLDHLEVSMNVWRHLIQLLGGQAFVVVALTLFVPASAQAGAMYGASEREERLVTDPVRALRNAVRISGSFLLIGAITLTVGLVLAGLPVVRSLLHATALAISAVDTGGFALQSTSVGYYHSAVVETTLMVLMIAGALSYAIHIALWRRDRLELFRSLDVRTLGVSALALGALALAGLGRSGAFVDAEPLFRKGLFTLVSAHTTTGLSVAPPRLVVTDWGLLAPAAFVGAMAIGGTFASTAGGIKTLRIGVIVKGVVRDVRRVLLPESALVVSTYHAGRRHTLTDGQVRAAASVLLLFLLTFLGGALVPLFFGEELTEAVFESVSAASNGGLSAGILRPDSPAAVKLALYVEMWMGRLEFMAVFALFGTITAYMRGRS